MQEPASRLFTDSMLSAPFSTRHSSSSLLSPNAMGRASNIWIIGPLLIVIFIVLMIVGMLVVWRMRCSRKSLKKSRMHSQHGGSSVTKVALGAAGHELTFNNSNGGVPTETSKLLLSTDADGRPVMNAYEVIFLW